MHVKTHVGGALKMIGGCKAAPYASVRAPPPFKAVTATLGHGFSKKGRLSPFNIVTTPLGRDVSIYGGIRKEYSNYNIAAAALGRDVSFLRENKVKHFIII